MVTSQMQVTDTVHFVRHQLWRPPASPISSRQTFGPVYTDVWSRVHTTPLGTTALLLPVLGCGTVYVLLATGYQLWTIQTATEKISVWDYWRLTLYSAS